jgi:hypothetical protein
MADAALVAQYFIAEADEGNSPQTCPDSSGGGHHLTTDYGVDDEDAEWTTNGGGRGLNFINPGGIAVAGIADMSAAGSIGGQLHGATEASLLVKCNINDSTNSGPRVAALSTTAGDGELGFLVTPTKVWARWGRESGGGQGTFDHTGAVGNEVYGDHTFHFVFDSKEASQDDRCKFYIDKVPQAWVANDIPLNATISTQLASMLFTLGNRGNGTRQMAGALWYAELCTGKYTAQEVIDSYDALLLNHDADWRAGAPTPSAGLNAVTLAGAL